jgi:hypothetical protein
MNTLTSADFSRQGFLSAMLMRERGVALWRPRLAGAGTKLRKAPELRWPVIPPTF